MWPVNLEIGLLLYESARVFHPCSWQEPQCLKFWRLPRLSEGENVSATVSWDKVLLLRGCVFSPWFESFCFSFFVCLLSVWQYILAGCLVRLVTSHVRWWVFFLPSNSYFGSCMFGLRSWRKSPCVGTEDKIEVRDREFYTCLFSKLVGKTGMWKTKNDVYEKCR